MNVPFGMFHPDRSFVQGSTDARNNVNTVDLPVNVGVIKCGKEVILYDNGWNQTDYHKATGTGALVAAVASRSSSSASRPRMSARSSSATATGTMPGRWTSSRTRCCTSRPRS